MSCYLCGAPDGSEGNACQACTKKRKRERASGVFETHQAPNIIPIRVKISRSLRGLITGLTLVATIAVIAYFLCFSSYGPGLAFSAGERAYHRCLRNVATKMKHPKIEFESNASCEAIRSSCREDPHGKSCQSAIKRFPAL